MKTRIIAAAAVLCCLVLILWRCGQPAVPDGWQTREDGTVYIQEGQPVTGRLELEGKTYCFGEDGLMLTGWQDIDDARYFFGSDGVMHTGWLETGGKRYYFREQGSQVTGWLSLEGQKYYLTEDGAATGLTKVNGRTCLFDTEGLLTTGFALLDRHYYYGDENGRPVTGWVDTGINRYYFNSDYRMHTGWLELDGFTYYLNPDGTAARGEQTIDGEVHRFAFNGQKILLVNPWNYVPENYSVELRDIGAGQQVAAIAYGDFAEMLADCQAAGLHPVVCSSFRTMEQQQGLYQNRINRYVAQGYSRATATEKAGHSVAIPGTSEHQLGLALDIIDAANWRLDESQAGMPTQQWLMEHSWEYGWILRYPDEKSEITGIIYEPWHYRYVGREVAADIHKTGLCLEEYLDSLTASVG